MEEAARTPGIPSFTVYSLKLNKSIIRIFLCSFFRSSSIFLHDLLSLIAYSYPKLASESVGGWKGSTKVGDQKSRETTRSFVKNRKVEESDN